MSHTSLDASPVNTVGSLPSDLPFRFSLRSIIVVFAVVAVLLAVLLPAMQRAKRTAYSNSIANSMTCIWHALAIYDSAKDRLPPPVVLDAVGRPLSSWRFPLRNYWSLINGPFDFTAGWNAPRNTIPRNTPDDFYCWSNDRGNRQTDVLAVSGPDTAFSDVKVSLNTLPPSLILAIESADATVHWMEPGDFDVGALKACDGVLSDCTKGLLPDRIHVLFTDGEIVAFSPATPMQLLKPFLTIGEAASANRDQSLSKYQVASWRQESAKE